LLDTVFGIALIPSPSTEGRSMNSLLKRIAVLRSKLADVASGLALAERRVAYFKRRAKDAENPKHPHPVLRERADRRLKFWRNKERLAYRRRHFLRALLRKRLKQLRKRGPRVDGRRVIGGSIEERELFAMEYAKKHWRDEYRESTVDWLDGYSLTNVPRGDHRTDCSWWGLDIPFICGRGYLIVAFPRWTGSILSKGHEVSRHYAETHTGVFVVFGAGEGFHVGKSTGHGPFVFEHGTPTIDIGHFDEFGVGVEVRYRVFP
jgi:hypothetical protein